MALKKENLQLSHRELLTSRLNHLHIDLSEYTFADLYLFRDIHQYKVLIQDDMIFIQGMTRDHHSFIMPTMPLSSFSSPLLLECLQDVDYLFPIPEAWLSALDSQQFQWMFKEEDSDYIFKSEKLKTYAGRHLSKKRNLVYQLFDLHDVNVLPLTAEHKQKALDILDDWQSNHLDQQTDYESCREGLEKMEILQLTGLIFYVDENPSGFLLGEMKHHHYIIHFSKAQQKIKGLYQYMYQALAQYLDQTFSGIKWINMEQDLGFPQVRQAKHSYEPDYMAHKWRVYKHPLENKNH